MNGTIGINTLFTHYGDGSTALASLSLCGMERRCAVLVYASLPTDAALCKVNRGVLVLMFSNKSTAGCHFVANTGPISCCYSVQSSLNNFSIERIF